VRYQRNLSATVEKIAKSIIVISQRSLDDGIKIDDYTD